MIIGHVLLYARAAAPALLTLSVCSTLYEQTALTSAKRSSALCGHFARRSIVGLHEACTQRAAVAEEL